VSVNVAQDASPPRTRDVRKPVQAVSVEAVTQVRQAAEDWFAVLFRVAVVTGARRGEVVGLQWRDLDFDHLRITFCRSVVRNKDARRVVRDTTKTNRHGTVSVDTETMETLKHWRRRCVESALACGVSLRDDAFVFSPRPDGTNPRWPNDIDYAFRKVCASLGLSGFSFKDATRHFMVTRLIASGAVDLPYSEPQPTGEHRGSNDPQEPRLTRGDPAI
jgi:integrase